MHYWLLYLCAMQVNKVFAGIRIYGPETRKIKVKQLQWSKQYVREVWVVKEENKGRLLAGEKDYDSRSAKVSRRERITNEKI